MIARGTAEESHEASPPVGGATKRLFDLLAGSAVFLVLSPFTLIIAAAVRLTSRGPAFYRAQRVGVGGRVFSLWKFRSMRVEPAGQSAKITGAGDPRVTPLGRILRTTKLDELPQLINVLRGEMSLVGPRPEEDAVLRRDYPREVACEILSARPGMTGLLQVRVFPDMTNEVIPEGVSVEEFYRTDQLPRRVAVDLHYVREWSMALDLWIILRTLWCVLARAPWILLFGRREIRFALPPVDDEALLRLFQEHEAGAGGSGPVSGG